MTQNVTKNRKDFPAPEQLITNTTEAIMRGMIQDKTENYPSTHTQFIGLL